MQGRFVAYYRVSTAKQGASGLGLDAQRRAVRDFLNGGSWELVGEFEEVESGKRADRPALAKAMELCELTGARLLIAKLDRLSRNLHFLTGLKERGVDFVACDMPTANRVTVHIMASLAQEEREVISARTKAALSEVKAKLADLKPGETYVARRSQRKITRLGNPKGLSVSRRDLGTKAQMEKADAFAAKVLPTIRELRLSEGLSLAGVAARLNAMRVQTSRRGPWTPMAVKRVLDRQLAGVA